MTLSHCRYIYNKMLERNTVIYNRRKEHLNYYAMQNLLPEMKDYLPWLKEADSQALKYACRQLNTAFEKFFHKQGGYPRFHSKRGKQSYTTTNMSSVYIVPHKIKLPCLGWIRTSDKRIPDGKLCYATISHGTDGRYYVSICYEKEMPDVTSVNGSSFFAFGGARSHDIRGFATFEETKKDYTAGILQPDDQHFIGKLSLANRYGISVRVEGETWWRAELPTKNEMEYGISNLKKHHNKVDYIITHDGPISDLILVSDRHITSDPVNQYFEKVKQHTKYKGWYFGHHHMDKDVNRTEHAIYERIVQIM